LALYGLRLLARELQIVIVINPFFPNGGVERTNHGFVDNSPLTSTETH